MIAVISIAFASFVCVPRNGTLISYPFSQTNSVVSSHVPGSEDITNSSMRIDAAATCATADALLQRMTYPIITEYGGGRTNEIKDLSSVDFLSPSNVTCGVYGNKWFQDPYNELLTLRSYSSPTNRSFSRRISLVDKYVDDILFGDIKIDNTCFRWILPNIDHSSVISSGWKKNEMLSTADWNRYLVPLGVCNHSNVTSHAVFKGSYETGMDLINPFTDVDVIALLKGNGYKTFDGFQPTNLPALTNLICQRGNVTIPTNLNDLATRRLSYNKVALANSVISLCDTSLHCGFVSEPYFESQEEGGISVHDQGNVPRYKFIAKDFTGWVSAGLYRHVREGADLQFGFDDSRTGYYYIPKDADFEDSEISVENSVSVTTSIVDKVSDAWKDSFQEAIQTTDLWCYLKLSDFVRSEYFPYAGSQTYHVWAREMMLDGGWGVSITYGTYEEPPSHRWDASESLGYCLMNGQRWNGRVITNVRSEFSGRETSKSINFWGPTYKDAGGRPYSNDFSVAAYLPHSKVLENFVEKANVHVFETCSTSTNEATVSSVSSGGDYIFEGIPDDDINVYFRILDKAVAGHSKEGLDLCLNYNVYDDIEDVLSEMSGRGNLQDLKKPRMSAALGISSEDIRSTLTQVRVNPREDWRERAPERLPLMVRFEDGKPIFLDASENEIEESTVIYTFGVQSFYDSVVDKYKERRRSFAYYLSEYPYFILKWKFPAMKYE